MTKALASIALALSLAACGGGGDQTGTSPLNTAGNTNRPTVTIGGGSSGKALVTYEVSGSAKSAALTYSNATGGTEQTTIDLPWFREQTMASGVFMYISAQNQFETGTVTVKISVNGSVRKSSTSTGAYVIATASDSCC